jgi:hypothetical protein
VARLGALVWPVARMALASITTGSVAWWVERTLAGETHPYVATAAAILAGGASYALATLALDLEEAHALLRRLRRRVP